MARQADEAAVQLAGRIISAVDGAQRQSAGPEGAATRLLSRLLMASAGLAVALPAALSLVASPAVGLPAGAALAAAFALGSAGFVLGRRRPQPPMPLPRGDDRTALSLVSGLVAELDAEGRVRALFGRDETGLADAVGGLVGMPLVERIHVSDRLSFLTALDRLRQGGPGERVALRFDCADPSGIDGQFAAVSLSLTALADDHGRFSGAIAELADRRDLAARDRRIAALEAECAAAHDTKTRFLAAVSHELRTPLNAVLGFSDILLGGYFGKLENPRQIEYVGLIHQSGEHLLAVVNSMLDMSKIEAGRYELIREPFRFADALQSVEDMMALTARSKGVVLTARAARDIGEINADHRAVKQILINLVGNAVKFTDAGGIVTVDALSRDGWLTVTVADTGIGIPADKIAVLGQPFTQVSADHARRFEGTGLGLSLVKGLVELHGGRIGIASVEGEGTTVTVHLPMDGPMDHSTDTAATADTIADRGGDQGRRAPSSAGRLFPPVMGTDAPPLDAHAVQVAGEADQDSQTRRAGHGRKQAKTA